MKSRFSMHIQWSEEDRLYIVSLPEFGGCKTHGKSYEEAAKSGQEVLETLIEMYQEEGRPLPAARTLDEAEDLWKTVNKLHPQNSRKTKARAKKKLIGSR